MTDRGSRIAEDGAHPVKRGRKGAISVKASAGRERSSEFRTRQWVEFKMRLVQKEGRLILFLVGGAEGEKRWVTVDIIGIT